MKKEKETKIQVTIDVEMSDEVIRETALFNLALQSPGKEVSDADVDEMVEIMKTNQDFAAFVVREAIVFLANVGREHLRAEGLYPRYRFTGFDDLRKSRK